MWKVGVVMVFLALFAALLFSRWGLGEAGVSIPFRHKVFLGKKQDEAFIDLAQAGGSKLTVRLFRIRNHILLELPESTAKAEPAVSDGAVRDATMFTYDVDGDGSEELFLFYHGRQDRFMEAYRWNEQTKKLETIFAGIFDKRTEFAVSGRALTLGGIHLFYDPEKRKFH